MEKINEMFIYYSYYNCLIYTLKICMNINLIGILEYFEDDVIVFHYFSKYKTFLQQNWCVKR